MRETFATFRDLSRDPNGWFNECETISAKCLRHELKFSKSGNREDLPKVCCDSNNVKTNTAKVFVGYSLIQIGQPSNSAICLF